MSLLSFAAYAEILRERCEHCGQSRPVSEVAMDCKEGGYAVRFVSGGAEVGEKSHPGPLGQAVLSAASWLAERPDCTEARVYQWVMTDSNRVLGDYLKNVLSLGFLLLMKVLLALTSLVCGVSLLLNIIVFVVHIVKTSA